jgi:hypothetical protein
MEKCTFCIQRVQSARQEAKDEGRPIADGEVTPACAQTCPTQAIAFGNLRDEQSRASRQAEEAGSRSYHAPHVLNTRPSVTYLAKVNRDEQGGEAAAQHAAGVRRRAPAEQGGEAAAQHAGKAEGRAASERRAEIARTAVRRRAPANDGGHG